jgi:hypothetical protein
MSLLAFGEPFETVSKGEAHFVMPTLFAQMRVIYPLGKLDISGLPCLCSRAKSGATTQDTSLGCYDSSSSCLAS